MDDDTLMDQDISIGDDAQPIPDFTIKAGTPSPWAVFDAWGDRKSVV